MESQRRGDKGSADNEAALELSVRVARMMLEERRGHGDFVALGKLAFVLAAVARARDAGERRPSIARLMTETGLTYAEVKAMRDNPRARPPPFQRGQSRAERVLKGWWEDSRFHDEIGRPAILRMRGPIPSLVSLVKLHSKGALRARTIVKELLAAQAIERVEGGRYRAVRKTCVNVQWRPDSARSVGIEVGRHFDALFHNHKNATAEPLYVTSAESTPLPERDAAVVLKRFVEGAGLLLDDAKGSFSRRAASTKDVAGNRKRVWLAVQAFMLEDLSPRHITANAARKKRKPRRNRTAGKGNASPSGVGAR